MSARHPMTILHLFSGDLWAGAEVMIFHLLRRLSNDPDLRILALALNEGTLAQRLRDAGIPTHVIPESGASFPALFLKIGRWMRGRQVDVIHSHRYKENLIAWLLGFSPGVKRRVATLHGMPEPTDGWKTGLLHQTNFLLLRRGFSTVAVSMEMKRTLIERHQFHPDRVALIHNGIERAAAPPPSDATAYRPPTGVLHIGTVGRMVPVKDFDFLLKVVAEVARQVKVVRFSLLGEGPMRGRLVEQVGHLGLGENVVFFCP